MSQKHVKSRHTAAKEPSKAVSALSSLNALGNTVVIRLVLATVIFAVSLIISMPDFVGIILLVRGRKQQVWLHGPCAPSLKAVLQNAGMFLLIVACFVQTVFNYL